LSKSFVTQDRSTLDQCDRLAEEVHEEETAVTGHLLSRGVRGEMFEGVIRFPYRLERIGDMLENVLHCWRIKIDQDIPLGEKATEELGQLLTTLEEMMNGLRDAFTEPRKDLLEPMSDKGKTLTQMLEDFISAHWKRLEAGTCAPEASSLYREILDSVRWTNGYLERMRTSLLKISDLIQGPRTVM